MLSMRNDRGCLIAGENLTGFIQALRTGGLVFRIGGWGSGCGV